VDVTLRRSLRERDTHRFRAGYGLPARNLWFRAGRGGSHRGRSSNEHPGAERLRTPPREPP